MSERVMSGVVALMGIGLFIWCLHDGDATINVNFRDFPRKTHPKTYWTLMVCYAVMAILGVAGFFGWIQ